MDRLYQHTVDIMAMQTKVILATPPPRQLTTSPETHRSFNHTRRAADSPKEGKQELARTKYANDDYCLKTTDGRMER